MCHSSTINSDVELMSCQIARINKFLSLQDSLLVLILSYGGTHWPAIFCIEETHFWVRNAIFWRRHCVYSKVTGSCASCRLRYSCGWHFEIIPVTQPTGRTATGYPYCIHIFTFCIRSGFLPQKWVLYSEVGFFYRKRVATVCHHTNPNLSLNLLIRSHKKS